MSPEIISALFFMFISTASLYGVYWCGVLDEHGAQIAQPTKVWKSGAFFLGSIGLISCYAATEMIREALK